MSCRIKLPFLVFLSVLFFSFLQTAHAANTTGMIAYYTSTNPTIPKYRLWNGSDWSAEQNAQAIAGNAEWVVLRAAPTRPEYVLGAIFDTGSAGVLTVQVYNVTSNTWGNILNMTINAGTTADAYRFFDIVYENVSGNAMVVYKNDTMTLAYNVWNGASWSYAANIGARVNVPNGNCTTGIYWVELAANPLANKSNEITAVYANSSGKICGSIWTGSAWANSKIIDTSNTAATTKIIAAAYEQTSGEGFVAWNNATTAGIVTGMPVKNGAWTTSYSTADMGSAHTYVTLSPARGSGNIMLSFKETSVSDMNWWLWSGAAFVQAVSDNTTTATGDGAMAAAWHGTTGSCSAVYNDATNIYYPRNITCTGACTAATWKAVTDLYSGQCAEQASLDYIGLNSDPFSEDIMMTVSSQTTHYKCSAIYNTSSKGKYYNATTDIGGGSSLATGQDFMFEFDRCATGNLTVTTNGTAMATNQNTTLVITATAVCTGHAIASCGSVSLGLRYNFSGTAPNTWVNTTWGNKPFYNVSGTNPYSCGTLLGGQTCTATWTVNATGNTGTSWSLDANATSNRQYVYDTTSAPFVVNISAAAPPISLGFSLTVPGSNFSNSTAAYPGAATSALNFSYNHTMAASPGNQFYVNPCVVGLVSACQTVTTPVYIFTNTGNTNIAWRINASMPLPSYVAMFANKSNGNNATSVQILNNTNNWIVNASVPPGGTQNLWIWVNFTNALNVPVLNQTNLTSTSYQA